MWIESDGTEFIDADEPEMRLLCGEVRVFKQAVLGGELVMAIRGAEGIALTFVPDTADVPDAGPEPQPDGPHDAPRGWKG